MTADRTTETLAVTQACPLVVHVIVGLDSGGAELMLERLVTASRARGEFRHAVISLTRIGVIGQRLRLAGVEVRALEFRGALGAITGFWRLRSTLRDLRPDIVQTWMYHADFLGGLAARSLGIKRVIWGVRTTFVAYEGSTLTHWLMRVCAWLSASVPAVIVCAADASRRVHERAGYDASRMRVFPNGYDAMRLAQAASQRPASRAIVGATGDADVVIGACGRFNPVKDFHCFVRAASRVAVRLPNARFALIGRGLDANNPVLAGWLDASGVRGRFALLGERTDLPNCLAALDVFCLSSKSEGFPNVVCEAMGTGVPCVVTDVGDAAQIVGDTGEVVPKEDPDALAAGILRLAELEPGPRQERGHRARQRLEIEFSIEAARARYESLYRELLAAPRAA